MPDHTPPKRPEILAPAGTPQKLKTALHFGADAVYLGLKQYSMRSFAGNFDADQLEWAVDYAHQRGRKVYVALNIQPFDDDFKGLERSLGLLARLGPDGIIVADPGVLKLAQKEAPAIPVHLSTQTSVTNAAAARFWFSAGIRRIILAREISLERLTRLAGALYTFVDRGIGESSVPLGKSEEGAYREYATDERHSQRLRGPSRIALNGSVGRSRSPGELEVFAHGAVCVAWSGRCLLSLYWANRDPRRGSCAAACRWPFNAIEDRLRPGQPNPVEQDEQGTYFFDAKDLCALPLLDRLMATGIHALKIEGRTRSPHYVAVTTDVYRHAAERIAAQEVEAFREDREWYMDELARPPCRGFSTHFLDGEEDLAASYNPEGSYAGGGNFDYVGRIERATSEGLVLRVQNAIQPGQPLEVRDQGMVCEAMTPDPLEDEQGIPLEKARTGDTVLLRGRFKSGPEAIVRRSASTP